VTYAKRVNLDLKKTSVYQRHPSKTVSYLTKHLPAWVLSNATNVYTIWCSTGRLIGASVLPTHLRPIMAGVLTNGPNSANDGQ